MSLTDGQPTFVDRCRNLFCIREPGHTGKHLTWDQWAAKYVPKDISAGAARDIDLAIQDSVRQPDRMHPQYEHGHRAALHMASKRIRALPKVHGPGIAISDEALSEREAIADFLDELSS